MNKSVRTLSDRRHFLECSIVSFLILSSGPQPLRAAPPSGANDEAQTEFLSPIITEETLPDKPGELTLRLGTEYGKRTGETDGDFPYAEACFGLVRRFGATVNVPMAYHSEGTSKEYGIGDVSGFLKFLAVQPSQKSPAVVLGLGEQFPTGDKRRGLGGGAFELTPYVATLKEFGPLLLQGSVGWAKQVTGSRDAAWNYNWAASIPAYGKRLYFLTEINGNLGYPNDAAVAPGLKYRFSDKFSVGIAAPIGLNNHTDPWGLVTQFQFDF